jgi:hypothetical protein
MPRPVGAYMYWVGYLWENETGRVPTNLENDPPVTKSGLYHCPAQPDDEGWAEITTDTHFEKQPPG